MHVDLELENDFAFELCHDVKHQSLIPFKGTISPYMSLLLSISQITDSKLRFVLEGKNLNKYGAYKLNKDYNKYLKSDLVNKEGLQTITLVIRETYIAKFEDKTEPGFFIRVEGCVVVPKNANDSGTSYFSLHIDATFSIIKVEHVQTTLVFMLKISVNKYLARTLIESLLKGTLAFVVLQVDSRSVGAFAFHLTVAGGPTITYHAMVSDFVYRLVL